MTGVGSKIHVVYQIEDITSDKKIKEIKLREIVAAVCALLNSDGGRVVLDIDSQCSSGKRSTSETHMSTVIRILEQTMISIIGVQLTGLNIHFEEDKSSIAILVKKADSLITTNYNLYFPSHTQVMHVPATEKINSIINRKVLLQAIAPGSHQKTFLKDENCGFPERKTVQFKCLKSDPSKRTTMADRITGKGNKFSCYVSAFANHKGGHIYYGINDDRVVKGQIIPSEDDKIEVTKKVEKVINKMTWPEQIGLPKQGKHWEIFFEQVIDEKSEHIPSTFVIVIYVAACLGGVFTEEPECYEIVEGRVVKMSFATWKKRVVQPAWLRSKIKIPHSVGGITWSSAESQEACRIVHQELMPLINNGNWNDVKKEGLRLVNTYPQLPQVKLSVLSKRITACYRRGHFNKAQTLIQEYTDILPQAQDRSIFEVLGLYLNAALRRARGDCEGLKEFLFAALQQAELIEPGFVPAVAYVFAATLTDLIKSEDQTETVSPQDLSLKALQCLEDASDSPDVLEVMRQKSYITLATFYLGCNISGQRVNGNEEVRLADAKNCIIAVYDSVCDGNALSKYSEAQLNLVQSIYNYRYSQVALGQKVRYLGEAFNYAKKAESLARNCQFMELAEWCASHKALCTEKLIRTRFHYIVYN